MKSLARRSFLLLLSFLFLQTVICVPYDTHDDSHDDSHGHHRDHGKYHKHHPKVKHEEESPFDTDFFQNFDSFWDDKSGIMNDDFESNFWEDFQDFQNERNGEDEIKKEHHKGQSPKKAFEESRAAKESENHDKHHPMKNEEHHKHEHGHKMHKHKKNHHHEKKFEAPKEEESLVDEIESPKEEESFMEEIEAPKKKEIEVDEVEGHSENASNTQSDAEVFDDLPASAADRYKEDEDGKGVRSLVQEKPEAAEVKSCNAAIPVFTSSNSMVVVAFLLAFLLTK